MLLIETIEIYSGGMPHKLKNTLFANFENQLWANQTKFLLQATICCIHILVVFRVGVKTPLVDHNFILGEMKAGCHHLGMGNSVCNPYFPGNFHTFHNRTYFWGGEGLVHINMWGGLAHSNITSCLMLLLAIISLLWGMVPGQIVIQRNGTWVEILKNHYSTCRRFFL